MKILSRLEWGAKFVYSLLDNAPPATEIFLHHTVTRDPGVNKEPEHMRYLEDIGINRFGRGISYTFVGFGSGNVYEGHPVDKEGAHTLGHNDTGRGIVLVGNFNEKDPSPEALESVAQLVVEGLRRGWWTARELQGHRDVVDTACPGDRLYQKIPEINARIAELLAEPDEEEDDVANNKLIQIENPDKSRHPAVWITDEFHVRWLSSPQKKANAIKRGVPETVHPITKDELDDLVLVGPTPPGITPWKV